MKPYQDENGQLYFDFYEKLPPDQWEAKCCGGPCDGKIENLYKYVKFYNFINKEGMKGEYMVVEAGTRKPVEKGLVSGRFYRLVYTGREFSSV